MVHKLNAPSRPSARRCLGGCGLKCSQCQAENPSGTRFCGQCAALLATVCPACSANNPTGNKFCGQCATPLDRPAQPRFARPEAYTPRHLAERILTSKAALEGERKQVTVLFADLKGSMELLADRDPEEARKLLDPVLELMMEAVHHFEGTVNQVMGDGIMALFGAPVAHEDHAARACYAALRMQDSVKRYAEEARCGVSSLGGAWGAVSENGRLRQGTGGPRGAPAAGEGSRELYGACFSSVAFRRGLRLKSVRYCWRKRDRD